MEHHKTHTSNHTQIVAVNTRKVATGQKVGFCGAQVATEEQLDIILDSGSTISLFKDKTYLEDLQDTNQNLVMGTNAGSKLITKPEKSLDMGGSGMMSKQSVSCLVLVT